MRLASGSKQAEQARNDFAQVLKALAQRREEPVPWLTLLPSLDCPAAPLPFPKYASQVSTKMGR